MVSIVINIIPQVLNAIAWPIVVLIVICIFRRPISDVFSRILKVRASSKGIELVLEKLEKEGQLPVGARAELAGLSGNDVWALDDLANNRIATRISEMKPAQRVIARTLVDSGLLMVSGEGPNRQVVVTPLGRQILQVASTLL